MKIIDLPINDLKPYKNNPRKNDQAVDAVAASIKEFGFKIPIIIDKNGVIVAGHTRLKAAKKLGLDSVPVIKADDLTDEQVRAFRLADFKDRRTRGGNVQGRKDHTSREARQAIGVLNAWLV